MEDERNTQLHHQGGEAQEKAADQVEVKDRGILDTLLGRKKPEDQEKKQEEELVTGMEKVTVAEPEKHEHKKEEHEAGEKKESLLAKLHRTSSSSSSSSDEEEEVIDENGEIVKRKKKKGLKEKIKEKLPGHKDHAEGEHHTAVPAPAPAPVETHAYKEDDHKPYVPAPAPPPVETHVHHHDHAVVVQKIEDDAKTDAPPAPEEEKKGLLDKIKEKLPGGHKKPEDAAGAPAVHAPAPTPHTEDVSSPDGKEKKGLLGKIMDKIPGYNKGSGEEDHKAAGAAAGEHKTTSS
ncbi:hypothetical protein SETIT_1G267200v2 [Setaria italica]|uniref:Dehydrin n=2 Tax=Setaria TaxID=4554 RepID=K3YUM9_SETIT|nr:dehydrin COR410 [Setaria italica]XP_034569781.1 dehydrin COR410-like [Setaria viridis]RCV07708.1 hypothetical protein SETIT_1G267200v2 [Setaria italica]TKW40830.1 hypothetical protein SEVIR_1G271800v2 [Setaria viridis]